MTNKTITILKERKMKSLPKTFTTNKSIVDEYDLEDNYKKFSKTPSTKRGRAKESFSDAKNTFMRASLDEIFGTEGSLIESWRVGLAMFDGCCYLCNEKIYSETGEPLSNADIQADHIVSHKFGGTASAGNLLAAHRICNNLKADTLIEEFLSDKPEQLAKVRDFQKFYDYTAPDMKTFKEIEQLISEQWEELTSRIRLLK